MWLYSSTDSKESQDQVHQYIGNGNHNISSQQWLINDSQQLIIHSYFRDLKIGEKTQNVLESMQ